MSSVGKPIPDIPAETFQAARKVYHIEHVYLSIGDHLGEILTKVAIPKLDPSACLNPEMISRLALVTAFQYAERIPDELAAQATLKRMDWKYALHLPVQHPGIAAIALCQYRQNLYSSTMAMGEFSNLLESLGGLGLYAKLTIKALDPGEVIIDICNINHLYQLARTMKAALSLLISLDPDWLRVNALPQWYIRYQTDRLGQSVDWDNNQLVNEIRTIEGDINYIHDLLCKSDFPIDKHIELVNLFNLWEILQRKGSISGSTEPWCANHAGRFRQIQ